MSAKDIADAAVERLRERVATYEQKRDAKLAEQEAAVLVSLVADNLGADVQELLTLGNPLLGVKPGALRRALAAIKQEGP